MAEIIPDPSDLEEVRCFFRDNLIRLGVSLKAIDLSGSPDLRNITQKKGE
jgi:hypothetical protein